MIKNQNRTVRLHLMLTPEEADAIENYQFDNRIRSQSEAVRQMIKFGPDGERQRLFEKDLREELWKEALEEARLQLKAEFEDEVKDLRKEVWEEAEEEIRLRLKDEYEDEWKERERELREEWEEENR